MWEDAHDNTLMHLAAAINHQLFVRKAIATQDITEIHQAVLKRNADGLIPYYLTEVPEIRQLLAWAETQDGCYPLITQPRLVIFYSDEDRPGSEEERESFMKILPELGMEAVVKKNPSEDDIYDLIRQSQDGELSALIVMMMSHGDSGTIKVKDKHLPIRNIILQMNSSKLLGIPKVC